MGHTVKITPRSEREAIIKKRREASGEDGETIYDFRSGTLVPKVISLPIDLPVYRMENSRTFTAQQTSIAREGKPQDYFEKGQELNEAQQMQHAILFELAKRGTESVTPIVDVLVQEGQRKAILITSTGVVVNGNRRLSAMRELVRKSDGSVDTRFQDVKCAVLPEDVTADELDDIEADEQARRQTKLDYDWIGDAHLIRKHFNKGRTIKEVADRLRRNKSEIENVLQAFDEADLYLGEWLSKPGEYDRVQEGQQIFGDIPKNTTNKNSGLQNASRAIAWTIFENRDRVTGRVYRLNPAFGKLAPKVLERLQDELELEDVSSDDTDDGGFDFDVDIDADDSTPSYNAIIHALKDSDNKDQNIDILIEACETVIELDKGQQGEQDALKALSQANSKITGVNPLKAGEATLPAIRKQIETIRRALDKIENVVNQRQSGRADGE